MLVISNTYVVYYNCRFDVVMQFEYCSDIELAQNHLPSMHFTYWSKINRTNYNKVSKDNGSSGPTQHHLGRYGVLAADWYICNIKYEDFI